MRTVMAISACALALLSSAAFAAQGQMSLAKVWARLADLGGERGSVESAEFSPDSRYIVTGSKFDSMVVMWRTSDGAEVWRQDIPQEIERVAWTLDGRHVASVSEDGLLRLFRADTGAFVRGFQHESSIDALTASPDGLWFATGEEESEKSNALEGAAIRILSVPDLKEVKVLRTKATINNLDVSPDGALLASADMAGELRLWSTKDWSVARTLTIPPKPESSKEEWGLVATRFSPDGQWIAAAGFGGQISVWRVGDGQLMRRFNQTGRKIESMDWTADSRYLVTAGHEVAVRFFPMADILNPELGQDFIRTALHAPMTDALEYLRFNRDGTLLATAQQDGTVQLWTYSTDDPGLMHRLHLELGRKERAAREAAEAAKADAAAKKGKR